MGWKTKKSWTLEFWAFKIMKSGFYCTNLKQINSRKLLNPLFTHIFPTNDLKTAIIIWMFRSMIFLWFSDDFLCNSWHFPLLMALDGWLADHSCLAPLNMNLMAPCRILQALVFPSINRPKRNLIGRKIRKENEWFDSVS